MLRFLVKIKLPPIVGALQLYFFVAALLRGQARYAALTSLLAPPTTRTTKWRDGGARNVLGGGRSRAGEAHARRAREVIGVFMVFMIAHGDHESLRKSIKLYFVFDKPNFKCPE